MYSKFCISAAFENHDSFEIDKIVVGENENTAGLTVSTTIHFMKNKNLLVKSIQPSSFGVHGYDVRTTY